MGKQVDFNEYNWIIYEIIGYKVGICKEEHYPMRPLSQFLQFTGIMPRYAVENKDYRIIKEFHGTRVDCKNLEWSIQEEMGYDLDGSKSKETRKKVSDALSGKSLSDYHKKLVSEGVKKSAIYKCPCCNKMFSKGNIILHLTSNKNQWSRKKVDELVYNIDMKITDKGM